jgi:hypothetical protein
MQSGWPAGYTEEEEEEEEEDVHCGATRAAQNSEI